ncbi:hypothetical protein [Chroococcidiopsis thermalis]|nr:hypothetical protein [Chroococcidiopsis thermalis]
MVLGKWQDTDTNLDLLGDRLLEESRGQGGQGGQGSNSGSTSH